MPDLQRFFTPLFLIAAFIVASAGVSLLIRHRTPLAGWGAALMLAIALDLASYYLVLTNPAPGAVQFWFRILVVTYSFLVGAWLLFILVFSGHSTWVNWRTALLIGAVPVIMGGLVLARPGMNPLWISQGRETLGSLMVLTREMGWFGQLFIAYTFGIGFLSMSLLIQMLPNTNAHFRVATLVLFAGSLAIVVLGLLEATDNNPFAPIATLQVGYAFASLLAFLFVFWLGAGGILPIARVTVFEHVQDGVLVLDRADRVVDLNPAAAQIIGHSGRAAVGKPVAQVWPQGARFLSDQSDAHPFEGEQTFAVNGLEATFDVKISPVVDVSRERMGRAIVLRNVTGRERMEKSLQEHTRELTRTNRLVTALAVVASRLGNTTDSEQVLDVLGTEMRKLGLDCAVVTFDPGGESATIKHLSFDSALVQTAEKLTGFSVKNYVVPRRHWPGNRILTEKAPVWYPNPPEILRRMFPQVPETIARKAFRLLGIQPSGQICILPLLSGERVIGAMPIWGADLQAADSPVLAVFASQVAGILQNAIAYEGKTERATELARSNSMILALSKVASQIDSTSDFAEILETFGAELKKMGMDCMVSRLADDKQSLIIQYVSIKPDVIRWAEKMTGRSLTDLTIPRHRWPTEKVVAEKLVYWDPNLMKGTLNLFPILPESLQRAAMKMAGVKLDDPVCYLPLTNEEDTIGVLAVWGAQLQPQDVPALSVFASQLGTALKNSRLLADESRRTRQLTVLLEASEATSSSLQLDTIFGALASQLLEISGFQSCYISEWDKATDTVHGRIEHARTWWTREKMEAYSLADYSCSKQVLLTGQPVILQGDFEAEEKTWMTELGRTALIMLALQARGKTIGLVELATTKKQQLFDPQVLPDCRAILANAATALIEPLTANHPQELFKLEDALKRAAGAEICSFSEWDRAGNSILTVAVAADIVWPLGQGRSYRPTEDSAWKLALHQGQTSAIVRSEGNESIAVAADSATRIEVESLIIFPLQRGNERIGLVELYDFCHKTRVKPEQIALLRTIADKASYSIEHARLLQLTQQRLDEKTALLKEKEVLLKEIHHRVKNNLQIISSLLNLQSRSVTDLHMLEMLRDSQSRVKSMALVHEKLYGSPDLNRIDFAEYVRSLTSQLLRTYSNAPGAVTLQLNVEEVWLDVDTAIPCGLILTELVSNALKYAFPNGQPGEIGVNVRHGADGQILLHVSDTGVGFPDTIEFRNSPSLGLKLVNTLVDQIGGVVEMDRNGGTEFKISFQGAAPEVRS